MSTSRPPVRAGAPVLPARALLVAPTIERASLLAAAFDDALIATPDEVASLLLTRGHDLPCVVVAGVTGRSGRLATVIKALLASCPADVQFMLEAAVVDGWEDDGAAVLSGLALVDRVVLAGVPCLRFLPAADPKTRPDLAAHLTVVHAAGSDPHPDEAWRRRIDALEVELAETKAALATASARLAAAAAPPALAAPTALLRRLRGAGALALLAALLCVGAALALTVAADVNYADAMVTALLAVALLQLGYVWRSDRRLRSAATRVAAAVRVDGEADAERSRDTNARLAGLEKTLAVLAASSVDTARAIAALRDRSRGGPEDGGLRG